MEFLAISLLALIFGGLTIANAIDSFERKHYFLFGCWAMATIMEIVIMITMFLKSTY